MELLNSMLSPTTLGKGFYHRFACILKAGLQRNLAERTDVNCGIYYLNYLVLMTQQEQNKQIVQAYVIAFNQGDLEGLRSLFAPEAEIQGVMGKGMMDKVMPVWEQLDRVLVCSLLWRI